MKSQLIRCVAGVFGVMVLVAGTGASAQDRMPGFGPQPVATIPGELVGVWAGLLTNRGYAVPTALVLAPNGRYVWIMGNGPAQTRLTGRWCVANGQFVHQTDDGFSESLSITFSGDRLMIRGSAAVATLERAQ